MKVEVVSARGPDQRARAARRAEEVLIAGGLVIHPTETVYGIGGDGSSSNNRLIARVKRRSADLPLILLTPDLATLQAAFGAVEWPREAEVLAQEFWPGPLTLVVRCPGAPEGLAGPGGGIAVRVSPEPAVVAILACWRRPLTSTSANLSGEAPARTLEQALRLLTRRDDLEDVDRVALAIDAGQTRGSQASTIVSLVERPARLIREGPVAREQIERWLPELR